MGGQILCFVVVLKHRFIKSNIQKAVNKLPKNIHENEHYDLFYHLYYNDHTTFETVVNLDLKIRQTIKLLVTK